MNRWMLAATTALFLVPQMAWPQAHQPYAGQQARAIKALSDQEMADLNAGRGMGMALAAELNGYPGPVHVLELAEAVALGEKVIAAEADLDRQFAGKSVTEASLIESVQGIASLQAALRAAH